MSHIICPVCKSEEVRFVSATSSSQGGTITYKKTYTCIKRHYFDVFNDGGVAIRNYDYFGKME